MLLLLLLLPEELGPSNEPGSRLSELTIGISPKSIKAELIDIVDDVLCNGAGEAAKGEVIS